MPVFNNYSLIITLLPQRVIVVVCRCCRLINPSVFVYSQLPLKLEHLSKDLYGRIGNFFSFPYGAQPVYLRQSHKKTIIQEVITSFESTRKIYRDRVIFLYVAEPEPGENCCIQARFIRGCISLQGFTCSMVRYAYKIYSSHSLTIYTYPYLLDYLEWFLTLPTFVTPALRLLSRSCV